MDDSFQSQKSSRKNAQKSQKEAHDMG
jgi:hypothetical protein